MGKRTRARLHTLLLRRALRAKERGPLATPREHTARGVLQVPNDPPPKRVSPRPADPQARPRRGLADKRTALPRGTRVLFQSRRVDLAAGGRALRQGPAPQRSERQPQGRPPAPARLHSPWADAPGASSSRAVLPSHRGHAAQKHRHAPAPADAGSREKDAGPPGPPGSAAEDGSPG